MKQRLVEAILNIRQDSNIYSFDEASTKAAIILRFLSILNWDTFNVNIVKPEYTVGSKRVDYSLRINESNKIFIEVKRIREELDNHQEQLLNYSFQEGVRISILTNGIIWWLYLPLNEGSWEERRFYGINILEQEPQVVAEKFVDFLSFDNIKSGKAVENAEKVFKSQKRKLILKQNIPLAWNKIVADKDDFLIELLMDTTENICGFRPEKSDIQYFLNTVHTKPVTQEVIPAKMPFKKPKKNNYDSEKEGKYINKRITSFTFLGKKYHTKKWFEFQVLVAEHIYNLHSSDFERCLQLKGTKMSYYSDSPHNLKSPKLIGNSQYYVETYLNNRDKVKHTKELMSLFGYSDSDLIIEYD